MALAIPPPPLLLSKLGMRRIPLLPMLHQSAVCVTTLLHPLTSVAAPPHSPFLLLPPPKSNPLVATIVPLTRPRHIPFRPPLTTHLPLSVHIALATTLMTSHVVVPPPYGMGPPLVPNETPRAILSTPMGSKSTSTGNVPVVAKPPPIPTSTSAQGAVDMITVCMRAVLHRRSSPLTPYHSKAWLHLLRSASLLSKYPLIPHSFLWNLQTHIVTLVEAKRKKYCLALIAWQGSCTHALLEVQKLHGKLLHASSVIPAGRAYLTGLEAMLSICHDEPFKPRTPP
ncbi:hypothetical protein HETIRDRAFT_453326 [Heterobasidion irregulare TC 32-1]|uniref:Uncharacterized protein n=1 Tax=Heterobasidion irregulare (strain TC 32-1) TaxID=747525 RepID=W4JZ24_HETIT|nr:uncharacterized protein HETIRDRAFT_453326 [Heterobasidion irregulare TC 32-1]ETW78729.1 hypothetical protein HETIRDRAFT_453326 [Heterobasidion irregulare TC 32-1]